MSDRQRISSGSTYEATIGFDPRWKVEIEADAVIG
jgi:hypothetical protein